MFDSLMDSSRYTSIPTSHTPSLQITDVKQCVFCALGSVTCISCNPAPVHETHRWCYPKSSILWTPPSATTSLSKRWQQTITWQNNNQHDYDSTITPNKSNPGKRIQQKPYTAQLFKIRPASIFFLSFETSIQQCIDFPKGLEVWVHSEEYKTGLQGLFGSTFACLRIPPFLTTYSCVCFAVVVSN